MYKTLLLAYLRFVKKLTTPARIIEFSVARNKNKLFLFEPHSGISLTYGQWYARVQAACARIKGEGKVAGDVYMYSAPNTVEYFEVRAACHILGLVFFGIPPFLDEDTKAYFRKKVEGKNFAGTDVATLNLSSGTTQKIPKIVQLSNQNWVESVFGYVRNASLRQQGQIVFLCTVSFMTAGSTTFLPSLLAGVAFVIINEECTTPQIVEYIKAHNVNRLYITPSRLIELLDWCKKENLHIDTLDNIVIGTERMPPSRLKEVIEYFGGIVTVGYGMVEALPPLTMLQAKNYFWPGSVGKAAKGVKVKLGPNGRVEVKSKTVSLGYLDNLDENAKHFKDGWFLTNDYGNFDSYEYLSILGREDEALVDGPPRRYFARELEDRLHECELVSRCAVIKIDGKIIAFVALRCEMDEAKARYDIETFCVENFSTMIVPHKVIIMKSLPLTKLGKLDRLELRGHIT